MNAKITELVECLELCLANIEQDTFPLPAQVKRIRQAIVDGKALCVPAGEQTLDNLLSALGAQVESLRPSRKPDHETISAARTTAVAVNAYVRGKRRS